MDIALTMSSCGRPAMNTIPVFYTTGETVFPDMTPDGYRFFPHLVLIVFGPFGNRTKMPGKQHVRNNTVGITSEQPFIRGYLMNYLSRFDPDDVF